jgi:hypothetical protein
MKYIAILLTMLLVSACSIKEPRVAFGKKCQVSDDKVTYSYVWIYDKNAGLPADTEQCAALPKKDKK